MAAELHSVKLPDKIKVEGKTLQLNGLGLRTKTIFKAKVYVAGLYLENPSTDDTEILHSDQLKQIDIVFLRNVESKNIVDSWNEGFEANCKTNCDSMKERLTRLNAAMTDVKEGQIVTLCFYPNRFKVSTPGHSPQWYHGRDFEDVILATFIGERPPTAELKDGMLGKFALSRRARPQRDLTGRKVP